MLAAALKGKVKKIFLVHGEEAPARALQEKLAEQNLPPAAYPQLGQTAEL